MIFKDVTIDLKSERKPFEHFFRATGYANADYTYTPPLRRMYDNLQSFEGHMRYMRLHNILTLHGQGDYYIRNEGQDYGNPKWDLRRVDTVVTQDGNGKLHFDWEQVDKVYDIIIGHGMHPIVEAVYMPQAISLAPDKFYLPKSFKLWEEVIDAFVRHWIEKYGIEEVREWYFEIWNEPDNHKEWKEDPSSFFALYDYFEAAVHGIDETLRVGGPATKQWDDGKRIFKAFLDHCDRGVNYKSGEYGTRIDFISVHCKGGHPTIVGPSIDFMFTTLREYIGILKEYPKYAKTEFFNDESDIVWEGNMGIAHKNWLNFRNTHYAPGFTAKMINTYCSVVEDELGVNLKLVDSDNCHLPWERSFFSGNRSQFTVLGAPPCSDIIRKPIFNIFPLLAKLGTERYIPRIDDKEFGVKYGVLATKDNEGGYAFMLWNFEDGLVDDVNERTIRLRLQNLDPQSAYDVLQFRIDGSHSSAYGAWHDMGKPYPLSIEQIKTLREREGLELLEAPSPISGKSGFEGDYTLPMHGVSLLMLVKRQDRKAAAEQAILQEPKIEAEDGALGNKQLYIRWNFSKRRDLTGYRVYRSKGTEAPALINRSGSTQGSYYVDMDVEKGASYGYAVSAVYADGSESPRSPAGSISL